MKFLQLVIVIRMAPNLATRKVVCVIVKAMLLERIVTNVAIGIMAPFQTVKVSIISDNHAPSAISLINISLILCAECKCFKEGTESCDLQNGSCSCKYGYCGDFCQDSGSECNQCPAGTYGYPECDKGKNFIQYIYQCKKMLPTVFL